MDTGIRRARDFPLHAVRSQAQGARRVGKREARGCTEEKGTKDGGKKPARTKHRVHTLDDFLLHYTTKTVAQIGTHSTCTRLRSNWH